MPPEIIGETIFWLVFAIIMIGSVVSVGLTTVVALGLAAWAIVPVLRRSLRQRSVSQELRATGVAALATLLSMEQTGLKMTVGVDERWQVNLLLQVQPADGPAFQAQVPHMVSVLELPQYQPGATLMVLYDPADHSKVAVLRNLGVLANVVQAPGMEPQAAHRLLIDSELLETDLERVGVVAPAQVVAADKVGVQVYHGAAEMLQLTLDVRPPEDIPFRAQTTALVAVASLPKYQPGAAVTVRYDPRNPQRVVLESAD